MPVLKYKSKTYLMVDSKACFKHHVDNYCLWTAVLSSYSKTRHSVYPFCLGLAFNVAAINHNRIFEAQRSSLRDPTKRE